MQPCVAFSSRSNGTECPLVTVSEHPVPCNDHYGFTMHRSLTCQNFGAPHSQASPQMVVLPAVILRTLQDVSNGVVAVPILSVIVTTCQAGWQVMMRPRESVKGRALPSKKKVGACREGNQREGSMLS